MNHDRISMFLWSVPIVLALLGVFVLQLSLTEATVLLAGLVAMEGLATVLMRG